MIDLEGQRILVTGGSRGIGRAIARLLLQQGAFVVIHYNSSGREAQEIQDEFGTDKAVLFRANLENLDESATLIKTIESQIGHLDTVVLNAGVFLPHQLEDPLDDWLAIWKRTMDINLNSAGILTRTAIEHFRSQGQGRLVYIGSRAAFRGETPEYLAYAASKGGLTSLAKTVARSFGKENIKAFVLAPGFTRTEMAEDAIASTGLDQVLENSALKQLTEPEDIAPLVALICSGQMDHATGTTIDINAGSHIR